MWNPDRTSISYQHMKTWFCDWSILSTMGGYDVIQCQKSGLLRRSAPPIWENCIARRSSLRDLLSDLKRRRIFSIVYWLTCISMTFSSESKSSIHWFFGSKNYHEVDLKCNTGIQQISLWLQLEYKIKTQLMTSASYREMWKPTDLIYRLSNPAYETQVPSNRTLQEMRTVTHERSVCLALRTRRLICYIVTDRYKA